MSEQELPVALRVIAASISPPSPGEHHDLWGFYRNPTVTTEVVVTLSSPFQTSGLTHVVGIETRGLALAALVAEHLHLPFIPVRKAGGYLPGALKRVTTQPDWEGKSSTLEIQSHALNLGARVLLVDDWFTTGSQALAAAELVRKQGAVVEAIAVIAEEFGSHLPSGLATFHALLNWNDARGSFNLSSHFKASVDYLDSAEETSGPVLLDDTVSRAVAFLPSLDLSLDVLSDVSRARDHAERLRFRVKTEVDEGLKASPETVAEQIQIKRIFRDGTLTSQYFSYRSRLDTVVRLVEETLEYGAAGIPAMTSPALVQYWRDLAFATGLDNAHAMYLASGNWGFTVFEASAARLRVAAPSGDLPALLTGGIQDARTLVPTLLADYPRARSRSEFVRAVRERGDWAIKPGIVPLVCFEATRLSSAATASLRRASDATGARFEEARRNLPEPAAEALRIYRSFYELRRKYDLYEYFGLYAFLRHRVISLTAARLAARSSRRAAQFRRTASLYQYERAMRIVVETLS